MKIKDLINKEGITLNLKSTDKDSVIRELASIMEENGIVDDLEGFIADINEREKEGSTGVGLGVAIPHAKSRSVKKPSLIFGRSQTPVPFASHEENEADMFFMIAAPEGQENLHLQTLAKLSRSLIDENFRRRLRNAQSSEAILTILSEIDSDER